MEGGGRGCPYFRFPARVASNQPKRPARSGVIMCAAHSALTRTRDVPYRVEGPPRVGTGSIGWGPGVKRSCSTHGHYAAEELLPWSNKGPDDTRSARADAVMRHVVSIPH